MEDYTGLPYEFTLAALYRSHFDTWSGYAELANEDSVKEYDQAAKAWLVNMKEHCQPGNPSFPPPPLPLKMKVIDVPGGNPRVELGPETACGVDPEVELFLHPPQPVALPTPVIGPPYGDGSGKYFAFGDTSPVGTIVNDPIRGKLIRRQKPGFAPGVFVNWWEKAPSA